MRRKDVELFPFRPQIFKISNEKRAAFTKLPAAENLKTDALPLTHSTQDAYM
jgi:hypothetical protein